MVLGLIAGTYLLAGCFVTDDYSTYWPTQPGTTWRMQSVNYQTGNAGAVTVTIEPSTTFGGYPVTPWRFRKTHQDAYWGAGQDYDLRWMIVDSTYTYPDRPFFNEFFWALGHHALDRFTDAVVQEVSYHSRSEFPPYPLMPRQTILPYWANNDHGQSVAVAGLGTAYPLGTVVPNPVYPTPPPPGAIVPYSWWTRMRLMTRTTTPEDSKHWREVGVVTEHLLQVDYYEVGGPGHDLATGTVMEGVGGIRESWYFKRNVGLVEIRSKFRPTGNLWVDDPDWQALEMDNPDVITVRGD